MDPLCNASERFGNCTGHTRDVMVFSVDGSSLLGTEILLSAEAYNGQPCMTDGGGLYHDVSETGDGPYACHHFDTTP